MSNINLFPILVVLFVVFHCLMLATPIVSLFLFLFFIIGLAVIILVLNINYLAFVLISIYGGAIVVLFLLVSMLFNKKQNLVE